mmetsp:Transcript_131683/g.328366  ORF Transcript_131683/g.328366 Transcript_131683/m.328366 type:complete len:202 (-) Transcript_131683:39-644(-)
MEVDSGAASGPGRPAAGRAAGAASAAVEAAAIGGASAGAMDSDDDWDPAVGPGVVLRPHVLTWNVPAKAMDADGDEQQASKQHLDVDPLHDPAADEEDERWVAKQLLMPDSEDVRSTAAVLNCPGCFTPVCYQCQRHAEYSRQWRAVEVRNCTVDRSSALTMARGDATKYFAVRCSTCAADVGLLDDDGVYHLFHVLESLA